MIWVTWGWKQKLTAFLFAWGIYFALATIADQTSVPRIPIDALDSSIFQRRGGYAYWIRTPEIANLADSEEHPTNSPFMLTEDGRPLGPPHSNHEDIIRLGHGRFSHWHDFGLLMSTSDNSNPQNNGRVYRLVKRDIPTDHLPNSDFQERAGFAYWIRTPELAAFADDTANPFRSPYILTEDGRLLGPAHSAHRDIETLGHGRFSHWAGVGFIFSSSDGSDPRTNGRVYKIERRDTRDDVQDYARFESLGGQAYLFRAPELNDLSDTTDDPTRSPFDIFEDGKPLGPPHSSHADIAKLGHGRFSHWKDVGFIFSSSDGSNPQTNGRTYVVAKSHSRFEPIDGQAYLMRAPKLNGFADTTQYPTRSPFDVVEDGKPLGPPHSAHADIAKLGHGRFSHWENVGFIFSSSDGSDPRTNGRTYGVAKSHSRFEPIEGQAYLMRAPELDGLADTTQDPTSSPFDIVEDGRPLGLPHSAHADIAKLGHGRFSHWKGVGFLFSSSDGSDPRANGRSYSIVRRFEHLDGQAYVMHAPELDGLADTIQDPTRSPFEIVEDGKPLGPAHSAHVDIAKLGHGRFSHWEGMGFVFSSSDGSDPRTNGRTYKISRKP